MPEAHENRIDHATIGVSAQVGNVGRDLTIVQALQRPRNVLNTLVPPPTLMVGRDKELGALLTRCEQADQPGVVAAVHGMGGIGKTAFVRTLAARLADRFPDACLEVKLFGFTPNESPRDPGDILTELLGLVGYRADEIPATTEGRSQLWRSWMAAHRVLLVLDDARSLDQVQPLLPGVAGNHLVLISSRVRLDATVCFNLDALQEAEATELLAVMAGDSPASPDQLRELARLCGYLPLALRPVGELLAGMSIADLLAAMTSTSRRLEHVADGDREVQTAFTVSYGALTTTLKSSLRATAAHPGPDFDALSLSAMADIPRPLAAIHLAELHKRSMLTSTSTGRYGFHDLFAEYARDLDGFTSPAALSARQNLYRQLHSSLEADFKRPPDDITWLRSATEELRTAAHHALDEAPMEQRFFAKLVSDWLFYFSENHVVPPQNKDDLDPESRERAHELEQSGDRLVDSGRCLDAVHAYGQALEIRVAGRGLVVERCLEGLQRAIATAETDELKEACEALANAYADRAHPIFDETSKLLTSDVERYVAGRALLRESNRLLERVNEIYRAEIARLRAAKNRLRRGPT